MAKKKQDPQDLIARGMFGLHERKDYTYIPMLREKIGGLYTRIEDKQMQDAEPALDAGKGSKGQEAE
jgi:hypothetical protein